MKNVLLTTTALVAFAGAAVAEIGFGGSAEIKYNDIDGFSYGADLDVTGSAELGNGITASLSYGIELDSNSSPAFANGSLVGDTFPTITLESAFGTLSYGADPEMANDHFSSTDGMDFGFADKGDFEDNFTQYDEGLNTPVGGVEVATIRADVSVSGIDFSVSGVDTSGYVSTFGTFLGGDLEFIQVGASGSISSFDYGLTYDVETGGFGVNVGTTFSGFDIDVAYSDNGDFNDASQWLGWVGSPTASPFDGSGSGTATGIQLGYEINSSISVGAYYAQNTPQGGASYDNFGVSLSYASGPLSVDVAYDDEAGVANSSIDVTYEVNAEITAYAGYDQADGGYVGATYDLGNGAEAWLSYSDFDESGDPEFDDGITLGVSVEF